jgi:hypothetical protein
MSTQVLLGQIFRRVWIYKPLLHLRFGIHHLNSTYTNSQSLKPTHNYSHLFKHPHQHEDHSTSHHFGRGRFRHPEHRYPRRCSRYFALSRFPCWVMNLTEISKPPWSACLAKMESLLTTELSVRTRARLLNQRIVVVATLLVRGFFSLSRIMSNSKSRPRST